MNSLRNSSELTIKRFITETEDRTKITNERDTETNNELLNDAQIEK